MRRTSFLVAALLVSGSAAQGADDTPIDWLRRLMAPPLFTVTETFKPVREAKAALANPGAPAPRPKTAIVDPETTAATEPAVLPPLGYAPAKPEAPSPDAASPFAAVVKLPGTPMIELTRPPPAARSTCGVSLANLGVMAIALAPVDDGDCGIAAPVAVASLDTQAILLSTEATLECETAERLATWMHDTVQGTARATLGAPVTGLRVAASYACRSRNGLPDALLSEHAKGRAIDISAFRVGDRWVEVESGWAQGGDDASFLKAVRQSACGPFKTVLGPGADNYHSDHFHLDLAERRNGRTYCR